MTGGLPTPPAEPVQGVLGGVLDVLALVSVGAGVALALVAALGLLRLPDVLTRLHAGAKPQSLGVVLVAIGVALDVRTATAVGISTLVVVLQLVTAPVAAHMVGRAAYRTGKVRRDLLLVDELSRLEGVDEPEGGLPDGCVRVPGGRADGGPVDDGRGDDDRPADGSTREGPDVGAPDAPSVPSEGPSAQLAHGPDAGRREA